MLSYLNVCPAPIPFFLDCEIDQCSARQVYPEEYSLQKPTVYQLSYPNDTLNFRARWIPIGMVNEVMQQIDHSTSIW
jgi:hypothetical protein